MEKKIWILGDSPIVEEYTAFCVNKEFDTRVRINPDSLSKDLPKGAKHFDESEAHVDMVFELTNISPETKKRNLVRLDAIVPPLVPIISSSVTVTVAEQATWLKHPFRLVGVGAFPTLLDGQRIEFASSNQTDTTTQAHAKEFAALLDKSAVFVGDSVGLVLPRILSMIVNEACFAIMEGVAEGKDIDTAMKLGTNYPLGPIEWGERITPRHVLAVMAALHKHFGEDRYRPAPLLQKAALTNSFVR